MNVVVGIYIYIYIYFFFFFPEVCASTMTGLRDKLVVIYKGESETDCDVETPGGMQPTHVRH
jgi:hypothetical protein